ncbi:LptF/LptG family permease [Sandaracinobacter neustonicus]|uniref:LptF/LptG family permease n=1 Tax=Sandaracinobacter neustonicus TaxID=1715348 RepID=A0A501XK45_9SPHN|nr:LptF/LptG family permease [Sandaracinobacter neustonicus]TPE61052.1 LptF/LptG family permease [Sandaracinobacter neustonicus]
MLNAVDRYLFRLIIVPLVGTLVIAAMLLLLEKMLNLFDFVVNEGGPVSVVWRMLGNLIPEYLSLGIPIGVTLGILLGFRRLALSSELDALNSVGVGYGRMLRVPYILAAVFALLNFGIVGFLQPYSRYAYEGLRFELRSGALGASIKVGEFTRIAERTTLRVEQSFDQGADLRGVFVRAAQADGRSLAVSAARGQFLITDDPDIIILRLKTGTLVHDAPNTPTPRVLTFVQHDLPVNLPAMENFRSRGLENLESTVPELWAKMRDPGVSADDRRKASATFHRRTVQWVVMFVLPLLAVALAVPPKRSTSAIGVFLSVVILVTYHKISEYGERMGAIGRIDPMLAQWIPFALFTALSVWFYHVLAHKPGGQPIGALDRLFKKIGGLFKGLRKPAAKIGLVPDEPEPQAQP